MSGEIAAFHGVMSSAGSRFGSSGSGQAPDFVLLRATPYGHNRQSAQRNDPWLASFGRVFTSLPFNSDSVDAERDWLGVKLNT